LQLQTGVTLHPAPHISTSVYSTKDRNAELNNDFDVVKKHNGFFGGNHADVPSFNTIQ
jgi:hypothetical protein